MKNKQKEWHPATKPLTLLSNFLLKMHLNIANTVRPDTKSTDYSSRDTIPLQTNDTEENYKKSF
jgi:hypothetical protein